jgi:hypothetical protein
MSDAGPPPASGKRYVINVRVGPNAYAPGTMNQTMHK